jgi:hypothetical protein
MDTLLTVGLFGFCMAALTAIHLHLTAPLPEPIPVWTTADVDTEFFRIVNCEWGRTALQPPA